MAKIIITEQQFKTLLENNINELSSELLSRAAQEAFDNDDNRVRKFRYGALDSLEKEHPSFRSYPVERNNDTEFLQKNKNLKIQSFDSDYKTLDDLYNGVKQGKLLIHCRGMQGEETLETIYPEIGETVMEFYGEYTDEEEYGKSLVHELVFASDDFNWAKDSRDVVYFVYSDDFVRSLGDGQVQTPNGEIYWDDEDCSVSVETGDWFSYEPASVAAVMRLNNKLSESKEFLTENKSISDEVVNISKHIINSIVTDAAKTNIYQSEKTDKRFKEHEIICDLSMFEMDDINIYYLIYFVNSTDIDGLLKKYDLNCSYDEETRKMEIITYVTNGIFADDFEESVMHEVTHLFQYDKGMEKRKSLYDMSVELATNNKGLVRAIGLLMYHSFPHEQDAFVHQFYQKLVDLEVDVNHKTDYNQLICKYSRYGTLCVMKKDVLSNLRNKQVSKVIEELGFDDITFKKRILFALTRFKKKLLNACDKYTIEYRKKMRPKAMAEAQMTQYFKNCDILLENGYKISDYDKFFKTEKIFMIE